MSTHASTILSQCRNGHPVAILSGRDLADFETGGNGRIMPLVDVIREQLWAQGRVLIEFSRSQGLRSDARELAAADQRVLSDLLARLSQPPANPNANEDRDMRLFNTLLTGLLNMAQPNGPVLSDGRPLQLVVVVNYAEHLLPRSEPGHKTDLQVRALEGVLELSKSLSFRRSGNTLLLNEARPQMLDELLQRQLPAIVLAQPNAAQKLVFAHALSQRYPQALLDGITGEEIANAASNTPNRSLEGVWSSAHHDKVAIDIRQVYERKQRDIATISEGTLVALDAENNARIQLTGRMIERPMRMLMRTADGIRRGRSGTLRNILLAGPPSSGKTQLAMLAAAKAGVSAFELVTGKSQWVGESERRTMLQLRLLREQGASIGLIDEVEHRMQLDRNRPSHDSGTSEAIMGMYQTFLADASLSGRVGLFATSNRPFAISDAMRQRWVIVPVFSAVAEDLPAIIKAMLDRLGVTDASPAALQEAAQEFGRKNASPREIRESYVAARCNVPEEMGTDEVLLLAARTSIGLSDQGATILGDLAALQYCGSDLWLPWRDATSGVFDPSFPIPAHLKQFVDATTGVIDQDKLGKTVEELRSRVNI
ncbi:MAG: ATP-binding protein [Flavobacteriales bacterium]|nr:ATP-binding protein [Flavobacteriales bacterium]